MKHVYVVIFGYDYEGETLQGVFATRRQAETHPLCDGDRIIRKVPIFNRPYAKVTGKQLLRMGGIEVSRR